jgi:hypothetical protein
MFRWCMGTTINPWDQVVPLISKDSNTNKNSQKYRFKI